ncbi:MAG: glutamate-cysteine ligase family protein [Planctomycetota bacterium]
MGEHNVADQMSELQLREFTKLLLNDVQALELMLERDRIETGIRRIGAEQEMFLIDRAYQPAPRATEVLDRLKDPAVTTELARFNLEVNLEPRVYGGRCLSEMEKELVRRLTQVRQAAESVDARVLLTGILPTLQLSDLSLANMTPNPRYFALNKAICDMRGGSFDLLIKGVDELHATHDNVMLESCNTSFQIHFQVAPSEFARLYNLAQAVTAPVLAAAVNSPILLGRRLWKETRVALFRHSVDSRSRTHQARGSRSRVRFGDRWLESSVLEIFREDVARFRILLATDIEEDSLAAVERGEAPALTALRLHNGTVYRWNRACYGVHEGIAHLRIENRVLPAGPTILDEIANAAFFFGLMSGLAEETSDITRVMEFDDAKTNFFAAARHGLKAQFTWEGQTLTACDLIRDKLLPTAREGLKFAGLDSSDIDRYLGVLEERIATRQTGAQWVLDSWTKMEGSCRAQDRIRNLTAAMFVRQQTGRPAHEWELATPNECPEWRYGYQSVRQIMTTDLFTVRPKDLVDLAASLMDWEHVRHVPVEDDQGRLVGLVSHRALLRIVARGKGERTGPVSVEDIMRPDPVTVSPDTSSLDAIELMRRNRVGCLPVVENDQLVGIVTERDFIDVAAQLLEEKLRES